jgi:hypothetical protein
MIRAATGFDPTGSSITLRNILAARPVTGRACQPFVPVRSVVAPALPPAEAHWAGSLAPAAPVLARPAVASAGNLAGHAAVTSEGRCPR